MKRLKVLEIKDDGFFYDENEKKVEAISIGSPFVISFESTGRTMEEDESVIIHRVMTQEWRLEKQCTAYIYGEKMYNFWNIGGFPEYTMVAVQGYKVAKKSKMFFIIFKLNKAGVGLNQPRPIFFKKLKTVIYYAGNGKIIFFPSESIITVDPSLIFPSMICKAISSRICD